MQLRLRYFNLGLYYTISIFPKIIGLRPFESRNYADSCGKKKLKKFYEKPYSSSGFSDFSGFLSTIRFVSRQEKIGFHNLPFAYGSKVMTLQSLYQNFIQNKTYKGPPCCFENFVNSNIFISLPLQL